MPRASGSGIKKRTWYGQHTVECPLSKGNQANHPKFERPNGKKQISFDSNLRRIRFIELSSWTDFKKILDFVFFPLGLLSFG